MVAASPSAMIGFWRMKSVALYTDTLDAPATQIPAQRSRSTQGGAPRRSRGLPWAIVFRPFGAGGTEPFGFARIQTRKSHQWGGRGIPDSPRGDFGSMKPAPSKQNWLIGSSTAGRAPAAWATRARGPVWSRLGPSAWGAGFEKPAFQVQCDGDRSEDIEIGEKSGLRSEARERRAGKRKGGS